MAKKMNQIAMAMAAATTVATLSISATVGR
jgi:hypothetical protein